MTKSYFGFHDWRRLFVKLFWLVAALLIMFLFGLNQILIERLGELGAIAFALLCVFAIVFLWNLIGAPVQLQAEADAKIVELEAVIDNREVRQAAMARLWRLRKQGVKLRNQQVITDEEYEIWASRRKRWRLRVLKQAGLISPNFKAWLETLECTREPPVVCPPVEGKYRREHVSWRRIMSEILMRVEEYLTARMIRDD